MKALWFNGKSLRLMNLKRPAPRKNEALIQVLYAGICNTDLEIFRGYMNFQGVPGHEFVGRVIQGPEKWLGKRVVGEINLACGRCEFCRAGLKRHCPNRTVLGILNKNGAFAEYLTLPVENLHLVPESVSDLEAVFGEPLAAALRILDQVKLKKNQLVFVLGDGKLAQLIARALSQETKNLLVLGKHPEKLALLTRLGIKTALIEQFRVPASEEKPSLVIEATGNPSGLAKAMEFCCPRGIIVLKSTFHQSPSFNLSQLVVNEQNLLGSRCGDFPKAIRFLKQKKIELTDLISGIYALPDFEKAFKKADSSKAVKVILKCTS